MGQLKSMSYGRTHTLLTAQARSQFLNELMLLKPNQRDQKSISGKATARSIGFSTTSLMGSRPRAKNRRGNLRGAVQHKYKFCL